MTRSWWWKVLFASAAWDEGRSTRRSAGIAADRRWRWWARHATLLLAFCRWSCVPGGPRRFIRSLPLAVVFTVLASMIVALAVSRRCWRASCSAERRSTRATCCNCSRRVIARSYRPILHWVMQHRIKALLASAGLVAGSLALVPKIGFSLFPKAGVPQFLVQIEAEEGASVAATDAIARSRACWRSTPAVGNFFTTVGNDDARSITTECRRRRRGERSRDFCGAEGLRSETQSGRFRGAASGGREDRRGADCGEGI